MKLRPIFSAILSAIISLSALLQVSTHIAYAGTTIGRGTYPTSLAGTVVQNGSQYQITGGAQLIIVSTNDPAFAGITSNYNVYDFATDGTTINDGTYYTSGGLLHFDHIYDNGQPITNNNGYLMVAPDTVDSWISALNASSTFEKAHEYTTTFEDQSTGQTFTVVDLSQLVLEAGASFQSPDPQYNHTINATPAPTVSINSITSPVVQGQSMSVNTTETVMSAHENYQYLNFAVTNSTGVDLTTQMFPGASASSPEPLSGQVSGTSIGAASDGIQYTEVPGAGSPATTTTNSSGSGAFITSGLSSGTYTLTVYASDVYGRTQSASKTFTIDPQPEQPALTLSVSPTSSQATGHPFDLTANTTNASGGTVTFAQSGTLSYNGGSGTLSGNYEANTNSISYPAQSTATYQYNPTADSSQAGSETITASLSVPGYSTITKIVSVSWYSAPTITLSVNPTTSQTLGSTFTLTANTTNITSSDTITMKETKAAYPGTFPSGQTSYVWGSSWWNGQTATSYASYAFNQHVTSAQAQSVTYEAVITTSTGKIYPSNTVTATWTKATPLPTITLTISPTSLQQIGSSFKLTASTTNITSNDTITISEGNATYPGTFPSGQTSYTWPSPGSYSSYDFNQNVTSSHAQTVTYTATISDSSGQVITSGSVQATWGTTPSVPTITLSISPTSAQTVNQPFTLMAQTTNLVSGDIVTFKEVTAPDPGTFAGGQTSYAWTSSGSYTSYDVNAKVNSAQAQVVTYEASIYDITTKQTITSTTVNAQWNDGQFTLTATPTSLTVGQSSTLSATTTNPMTQADFIIIQDVSGDGTLNSNDAYDGPDGSTFVSTNATDGNPQTVTYQASMTINGHTYYSNKVTVTWNPKPVPATISFSPSTSQSLESGDSVTLSYTTTGWQSGDYVKVTPASETNITDGWSSTGIPLQTYSTSETEKPIGGNIASVRYEALLYSASGQLEASTYSGTLTWHSGAIEIQPQKNETFGSNQIAQISYKTNGWVSGDYVVVTSYATNAQHTWSETHDTNSSDSYVEIEDPTNGSDTTVIYFAALYNSKGQQIGGNQSGIITWKYVPPTITMTANPTTMVPDQPSNISYSVDNFGSGDYVNVVGTGGTQAWNASHLTQGSDSYTEVENPNAGQTIPVNYTATVYSSSGTALSSANLTIQWVNAWSGSLTMSANPLYLVTDTSTTLTASTGTALPSSYTVNIFNQTTGQNIDQTTSTRTSTPYTRFAPGTDTFYATISDGFEALGGDSNFVTVWWSSLDLTASQTLLPAGQSTTLTLNGRNIPPGYWMILENKTTGQILGSTQASSLTVAQTKNNPEVDTYQAYLSPNSSIGSAYGSSNAVSVQWYSATITANPMRLPVNQTSTITANAAGMPGGYVLDIKDQTSGQTLLSGQPGQTTVQTLQTQSSPTTHQYVAQIVQPSNPSIPALSVPTGGTIVYQAHDYAYDANTGLYKWNGSGWVNIPGGPTENYPVDLFTGSSSQYQVQVDKAGNVFIAVDHENAGSNGGQDNTWVWYLWEYQASTGIWKNLTPSNNGAGSVTNGYGIYVATNLVMALNPNDDTIMVWLGAPSQAGMPVNVYSNGQWAQYSGPWGTTSSGATIGYGAGSIVWDPTLNSIVVGGLIGSNVWEWQGGSNWKMLFGTTNTGGVVSSLVMDPNGNLYAAVNGQVEEYTTSGQLVTTFPVSPAISYLVYTSSLGLVGTNSGKSNAVYRWNGSSWVQFTSFPWSYPYWYATTSTDPDIPILSSDGTNLWISAGGDQQGPSGPYLWNGSGWTQTASMSEVLAVQGYTTAVNVGTKYFPYWQFNGNLPSYIPQSLFPNAAVQSGNYSNGFWSTGQTSVPNGTVFFQSTFSTSSAETVTVNVPGPIDDAETVWLDGKYVTNTTGSFQVAVGAGMHQVVIEGMNDGGAAADNPAGISAEVLNANSSVLVPNSPSAWSDTGYVTQLPAGWFSGAVGSYNFTETVEDAGQAPNSSANYTVTTTAANVQTQTNPVSVTWYNPSYNLSLATSATTLNVGKNATLTATSTTGGPSGDVIKIYNQTTGALLGTSSPGAMSYSVQYTEQNPVTDTFVASFVNPNTGVQDVQSNTVTVTWSLAQLTLSGAEVYHTTAWQQNLDQYNTYYSTADPNLVRSESDFWAGEDLLFRVQPSIANILTATVSLQGLSISPYAPTGAPVNFEAPPSILLTYDTSTGYLQGQIPTTWYPWLQYIQNGTYAVTFTVKSTDNQVATAQTEFTILNPWVSGNNPGTYFHEHQTY